jgi:hypothetical protein
MIAITTKSSMSVNPPYAWWVNAVMGLAILRRNLPLSRSLGPRSGLLIWVPARLGSVLRPVMARPCRDRQAPCFGEVLRKNEPPRRAAKPKETKRGPCAQGLSNRVKPFTLRTPDFSSFFFACTCVTASTSEEDFSKREFPFRYDEHRWCGSLP